MEWLAVIGRLVLGFILGTIVLWICSFTVNTQNSNIRTAAIYNAIMTVLGAILLGIGLIFRSTESGAAGIVLVISTIVTLVVSFVLLMRMYGISFLATVWLVIATGVVSSCVKHLKP